MAEPILSIRNLVVSFQTKDGPLRAVDQVSFDVPAGGTVAIVGESGSGKSVTSLSILGLIPNPPGRVESGQILHGGQDLLTLSERQLRAVRGNRIAMIFQEPMTSLNPVYTVGWQIMEAVQLHQHVSRRAARARAVEMLQAVGIPEPHSRADAYPHQLSGGMRQRVMIAMALSCEPEVLIADEPTTALDVTVQAQILDLLKDLQAKLAMSMVLITHDLGVVATAADHVIVMYAGRVMESAPVEDLFCHPSHPYTKGLLQSVPPWGAGLSRFESLGHPSARRRLQAIEGVVPNLLALPSGCRFRTRCPYQQSVCAEQEPDLQPVRRDQSSRCFFSPAVGAGYPLMALPLTLSSQANSSEHPLLYAEGVSKYFPVNKGWLDRSRNQVRAVDNLSLVIAKGSTVGLVGESGCGKSTFGRVLLKLLPLTSGRITFNGHDITALSAARMRPLRRRMQIIFQDPYSSLNPRMTVGELVGEALKIHRLVHSRSEYKDRITLLLEKVGLRTDLRERYPHELSGGQRQRVGIARALASGPEFIVCDEPFSALDVSIQAQIANLLQDLQEEMPLSFLLISHDLKIVEHMSHRVAVMYLGKIVELADTRDVYEKRYHPYTRALFDAIPTLDLQQRHSRIVLQGDVPSPLNPPSGCAFHPRCPKAQRGRCDIEAPPLAELVSGSGHQVACWFPEMLRVHFRHNYDLMRYDLMYKQSRCIGAHEIKLLPILLSRILEK